MSSKKQNFFIKIINFRVRSSNWISDQWSIIKKKLIVDN
jgi:hypothetical protein